MLPHLLKFKPFHSGKATFSPDAHVSMGQGTFSKPCILTGKSGSTHDNLKYRKQKSNH